jgi:hypothetical protein
MKSLFVLINAVAGVLSLLVGANILLVTSLNAEKLAAVVVALVIGVACLWLAKQTVVNHELRLL